jgi:hypothetical protein
MCGDISVREHFLNHYWRVEPFKLEDNLFEWASKALNTVLHDSWERRRNGHLEEQNTELKRQLKRAREISASRLKRLQKSGDNKPASEPEQPVEPFRPRLVAAE